MNTPNLSPSELAWGAFYAQLNTSAERLRAMMQNTPSIATIGQDRDATPGAEASQPLQANRRGHYATVAKPEQAEGVR